MQNKSAIYKRKMPPNIIRRHIFNKIMRTHYGECADFYFIKSLKLIANMLKFSAVIEGITIIFSTSLTELGFTFKRNESAEIIKIAIKVNIRQELM